MDEGADTSIAASSAALWDVWRRLLRLLPIWRMPYEWFFSPSVWTMMGLDLLSGLLRNRSTKAIFALLDSLPPGALRQVRALAALNHRRHEAVSRWTALAFVTLPASAALTLSQLSPATLAQITASRGWLSWHFVLAYVGMVVALYLLAAWRARQVLTVVDLALIQRGVSPEGGDDAFESPLEPPIGA